MSAAYKKCGKPQVQALGLCNACYIRKKRDKGEMPVVPGLMTETQATERRRRIILEMKADGYSHEAIAERFGGRGVRVLERGVSGTDDMVES